ncbi:MAG: acyl-CoA dehydrogenase [Gammaproteobacteria bacterium]|nr:acyl-CoA dehydrogenase [Gammaproteobacteria bacterium]
MPVYNPPLRDMDFLFNEVNDGARIQQLAGYEEIDREMLVAVLEEAGKFTKEVLLPINREGDEQACQFNDGKVTTPDGFKEAYQAFIESGWNSIALNPEYGGQGLPKSLHMMVDEMICATNVSFSLYPGLTNGAWNSIEAYGSDELKNLYFPKMAEGIWSGSMCLTEPHSGTDLGLVRTKAIAQDDGRYAITGTKIFITAGEHDLTENIIHLVLARTPDAPAGIKGISLFLVPKFLPNADTTPGEQNNVSCGSIEHKMGIKASATCTMNFENASGWLVGNLNEGMRAMFKMMNIERLSVGMQGLGLADCAYQNAAVYAQERLQGNAPGIMGAEGPEPLTVHPDIRRMLLTMRSLVEGSRAVGIRVGQWLDISSKSTDPAEKNRTAGLVELLTPVIKAYFSDMASEVTNLGVQIFGGSGFVREQGMEQLVRDARIGQIYEGTNGVQAMDLVGRKLSARGGELTKTYFDLISSYIEEQQSLENTQKFIQPLKAAFERLVEATDFINSRKREDPAEAGAAAVDYLQLFGLTALAFEWAQMAGIGINKTEDNFYKAKVQTAQFYMQRILPRTLTHHAAILSGCSSLMDFEDQAW